MRKTKRYKEELQQEGNKMTFPASLQIRLNSQANPMAFIHVCIFVDFLQEWMNEQGIPNQRKNYKLKSNQRNNDKSNQRNNDKSNQRNNDKSNQRKNDT